MKNNIKNLLFSEIVGAIMLFSFGFGVLFRGIFWVKEQNDVLDDSDFYLALHEVMPIWIWGVLVGVAGLFIMVATVFLASSEENTRCSWLLLIGGVLTGVLYFLMTSASVYHAINWLSTVHFAIMSTTGFIVAFIGGADIYARKK
ncbi:hypothetical protein [Staphylococcus aureus]|uniref:hypothetical protein n=1 Tax=Staphylococcus aureus TaxID=1280 RepID=UPI00044F8039|nr:hypothetical protein [Staphylococcus aureus]EZY61444.1 hypothetical protein V060_02287 [Staphylococcus aureus R0294]EZY62933.1 hypothetical protein V061_01663 [Staphylococcus aureus R0353]EZY64218.1 hypothetical protein V062_02525 [Staphylococcus aureus R0357]EZY69399.1 hypothetical protein V064_02465 [Staphylococcus aureus R0545]EZY72526.1 hypothetical protein V065_02525 [Staphylococcus aureus R0611]